MIDFYISLLRYSKPKSDIREKYVRGIWKNNFKYNYNNKLSEKEKDIFNKLLNIEILMNSDISKVKRILNIK